ncbi:MAG: VCBS repeat-containing protein [Verrucomicrobiales bacterium]
MRFSFSIMSRRGLTGCIRVAGAVGAAAWLFGGCGRSPSPPEHTGEAGVSALPWRAEAWHASPLAAAEPGTSGPLFEKVAADSAGLTFVHRWEPRDAYEATLIKTGFTGGGVAMGDYDGDNRCDVFLTRPHGGGRLFRNLGAWKFEDVTERAGVADQGAWATGAAFVDVNNDGRLDLAVVAYQSENRLYLNRGDGTFRDAGQEAGFTRAGANVKAAFADYDRDGDIDVFLVTNRLEPQTEPKIRYEGGPGHYTVAPEFAELAMVINLPSGEQKFAKAGQFDHLYRNELKQTGRLQFTQVSQTAGLVGADHGLDVVWWDADGDGWPDIYVADDFTDPDHFYRNNRDGTFTDSTGRDLPHTPWFTMGAAQGDLNNDGLFDLIATDMAGTTHFREKLAMGSMDAMAWFLDVVEPRQYMRNAVFLNSGTHRFFEAAHLLRLAQSDWTWSVKLSDLDQDGWQDVFVTTGFTRDYMDSDFAEDLKKRGLPLAGAVWLQVPELREKKLAFRNTGGLRFDDLADAWGLGEVGISFGAALGDLDGDGDQDLVVNNFGGPPSMFRNRASENGSHRVVIRLDGRDGNRFGFGAVVRVETKAGTQVRAHHPGNGFMSADEPLVHFGLGLETTIDRLTVRWPSGATQTATGLPADQFITLTEPAGQPSPPAATPATEPSFFEKSDLLAGLRHQERPFDDFAREPLLPNRLSQSGPSMAWGDVNGDGHADVFLGGAAGQAGQLFLRSAGGAFAPAPQASVFAADKECEDLGCLFFDADGDGDRDLYVVSGGTEAPINGDAYRDRLYLNDGQGVFSTAPAEALPKEHDSGGPVAVADFDRDGDLDLFVGTRVIPGAWPTSGPSRLLRNDAGRFSDVTASVAPGLVHAGMVTAALWVDADGDGGPDLFLATEYGPVRFFRNQGGTLHEATQSAGLAPLTGWWMSLAAADVDGDGDLDLAAGNQGQNTKYRPTAEKPQVVYLGDFEGQGERNIIEAKTTDLGLLPVRGRSCSSRAMPMLTEKFPTFRAFAAASLHEIYGAPSLDAALRLEATQPDSGIFLNEGKAADGSVRFTFRPFPRLAQISPTRALVFLHGDNDSRQDLFIAQNSFGPQSETGRADGGLGLLLTNQGDGSFSPLWPDRSGLVIPGEAADAHAVDLNGDGQTDLAVALNNTTCQAWVHRGTKK